MPRPQPWNEQTEAILGTDFDAVVAVRLGRRLEEVKSRRNALGILPYSAVKPTDIWEKFLALLDQFPDAQMAKGFEMSTELVRKTRRTLEG